MLSETLKFKIGANLITLDCYLKREAENMDSVLIFPGGGYTHVCSDREGEMIAEAFFERGLNAFVLDYTVGEGVLYPNHLIEASFAITYIKTHAAEFGIDPERIFTVGFSAGGHLSGSMAILHKDPEVLEYLGIKKGDNKPCGSILSYPVVTALENTHEGSFAALTGKPFAKISDPEKKKLSLEANVDEDSAPIFIWHTSEDQAVPVIGSLRLAEAYNRIGRAFSLHIYPYGVHGLALANERTSNGNPDFIQPLPQAWVDESVRWIKTVKSY